MDRNQLIEALAKADEAGDTEAAQILANEINSLGSTQQAAKPTGMDAYPAWQRPLVAADDTARLIGSGVGMGWSEKALAGIKSLVGNGSYEDYLKSERQATQDARDRAGSAGKVAEVGGSMVGPVKAMGALGPMAQVPTSLPLPARLLSALGIGGIEGGVTGGVAAAGNDQPVDQGIKSGMLTGAIAGPAVEGLSTAVNGMLRGKPNTPSIDDIRAQKDALYKDVEDIGATYPPDRYRQMVQDMNTDLVRPHGGVREARHPNAYDTLNQFTDTAANANRGPTLYGLDLDRQGVFNDMILPGGNERRFGNQMVGHIDNMINDTTGVQTLRGTPQDAVDSLLSARDANTKLRKMTDISEAMTKSQRAVDSKSTGASAGNELRQRVRGILDNDAKSMGYTPDEIAQMEGIVSGTSLGNKARTLASYADGYTGKSIAMTAGGGLGGVVGGVQGAGIGALAGVGASGLVGSTLRSISDRSTKAGTTDLMHLIATGSLPPTGKAIAPISAAQDANIRRALIALGAIPGDPRMDGGQ